MAAAMDPNILILNGLFFFFSSLRILHCLDLPLKASSTKIGIEWCRTEFCASHSGESASRAATLRPGAHNRLSGRQDPRVVLPSALTNRLAQFDLQRLQRERDAWSKVFFLWQQNDLENLLPLSWAFPAPPCHKAPLPSGGTGETEMGSLMSPVFQKNWNTSSVIRFYRIRIFNSTNTGLEDGSTGLRTGYSGQEKLLLWWQNSLKALPSNYSFKDNNVHLP